MSDKIKKTSSKTGIAQKIILLFLGIMLFVGIGSIMYLQVTEHLFDRISNTAELSSKGQLELANGRYSGDLEYGDIEGEGVFKFLSGEEYRGAWLNYKFEGFGELQYPSEGAYEGSFENGLKTGDGQFRWRNGDFYSGEWLNDYMEGKGKYIFADGKTLEGEFIHNEFQSGTFSFSNDTGNYSASCSDKHIDRIFVTTSEGTYDLGFNGGETISAKVKLDSGLKFEGSLSNGLIEGDGELTYPKGDTYTGSFSKGARSGEGEYVWSNGAKYTGSWKNDKMSGEGTYYYAKKKQGYKLTGTFKKGKPNGTCTYYKTEDQKYKTKWADGTCMKIWE